MPVIERYPCDPCDATGKVGIGGELIDCEPCDGTGITAIDCPGCGQRAVPIHETVFVAAISRIYCEPCGDRELERIAARRAR
jgi:RecJ-like exonuclease